MYSVFIVDDELLVREGLEKTVDWNSAGFTVAGTAANGRDALDQLEAKAFQGALPDVLLTDMRMEILNGVELIRIVKKKYPQMQIVIFTGYNDFSYAKAGIDSGVFAFLSKPILNENILEVFRNLKATLDNRQDTEKKISLFKEQQIDEQLHRLLINPAPEGEEILEFISLMPEVKEPRFFFTACLCLDTDAQQEANLHSAYTQLNERIDYHISLSTDAVYKAVLSTTETVLLIFPKNLNYNDQIRLIKDIQEDFHQISGFSFSAGISASFRSLSAIHRAYLQARKALSGKAFGSSGQIIDYMDIRRSEEQASHFSEAELRELLAQIRCADRTGAAFLLAKHFESADPYLSLGDLANDILDIMIAVLKQCFLTSYTTKILFGRELRPSNELQKIRTKEALMDYLNRFIDVVMTCQECMKGLPVPEHPSSITERCLNLIQTTYMNTVRIPDISRQLNVSTSYIMHLFKQETGMTVNDYLTGYRICLSQALIRLCNYKIYEISEMTGFNDVLSFRRAFYRLTGQSPSEYRSAGRDKT